jgi:lysophospholipid acyltransferase (LPLAT)-like uncharacterized protein
MKKKLLHSPLVQQLLGLVLGGYMHFAAWTTRWRTINEDLGRSLRTGGPVVVCYWHGRIMLAHSRYLAQKPPPTMMLISQSREGEAIARACLTLGIGTVRGSSETKGDKKKGAREATRAMLRHLKSGGAVAITPDGPKGPRMRAGLGPVQLARLTGAPLVGLAWSTERRKVFNSWDRFVLPGPFGRGVYVFGGPIHVARDASDAEMEAARLALETELIRITQQADALVGVAPVEPADTAPALADAAA